MARRSVLLALLLAACSDGRNYVVVSVASISDYSGVTTLHVDVVNDSQTGAVDVAVPTGSKPPDPFTFSLEFDPTRTGSVGIGIEARNGTGGVLARGNTVATLAPGVVQAPLTLEQLPTPVVTRLTPFNCERTSGGTQIFVNGTNFVSGSVVLWGTSATVLTPRSTSSTQLEIVTPRGNDFTDVEVFVRNPDGQTSSSNNVRFYYRLDPQTCPPPL